MLKVHGLVKELRSTVLDWLGAYAVICAVLYAVESDKLYDVGWHSGATVLLLAFLCAKIDVFCKYTVIARSK